MNNHVTNFLLVIISTIVGLYLVEGGLTYLGLDQPRTPRAIAAANLNIEYDERSKLDVIKELIVWLLNIADFTTFGLGIILAVTIFELSTVPAQP